MPSNGGDLTLATLWIPVAPSLEGVSEKFKAVGEEGRRGFQEGFSGGAGGDGAQLFAGLTQHAPKGDEQGRAYGAQFTTGLQQGLEKADVPGAFEPVMNAISGKQLLMVSAVAGAVASGVGLIEKGIEAYVELAEKGIETVIELTKTLGENFEHLSDQAVLFSKNGALMGDVRIELENLDAPATHLAETTAMLSNRLGLSGDALHGMSDELEMLRSRLGSIDVDALTQGLREFGQTALQDQEDLALLVGVQQEFGTSMNTVISQLASEESAFETLNLSYQQSIFFLAELDAKNQHAAQGFEKMISMAEKQASAQNLPLREYLDQESEVILGYDRQAKAAEAAGDQETAARFRALRDQESSDAFGTRHWIDAKDALEELHRVERMTPAELKTHEADVEAIADATHHLEQAWEHLMNMLTARIGPVAAQILEALSGAVDGVGNKIKEATPGILDTIQSWGDKFIQLLPDIREALVIAGRLFVDFGAVAVIALEPVTMLLASAAASVLLLSGHLQDSIDLLKTAANLPTNAMNAAGSGNDALDRLQNLPINPSGIQQQFDAGVDRARNPQGPSVPGPEAPGIQDKAKDANKSPQAYLDDEKKLIEKYADGARFDLAEQESQAAFGMHWYEVLGKPIPHAGPEGAPNAPGAPSQRHTTEGRPGDPAPGYVDPHTYTSSFDSSTEPVSHAPVVLASHDEPAPRTEGHTSAPHAPHRSSKPVEDPAQVAQDEQRERDHRQDRIDTATDNLADANVNLAHDRTNASDKQKALDKAQASANEPGLDPSGTEYRNRQKALQKAIDEHETAERELTKEIHAQTRAERALREANEDAEKPLKEETKQREQANQQQSGGSSAAQDLGGSFLQGLLSDLGIGNALGGKSPLQFGAVKMGAGIANWALNAFHPGGAAGGAGGGEHVVIPGRGEHAGPQAQQGAGPGIPATAEPNIQRRGWGLGPQPQIPQGTTLAGYYRPANYPLSGGAGASGVTTAAVINNAPTQPVTTAGFVSKSGTNWDAVAAGESGGVWSLPSDHAGAPYRGGLQILDSTWHQFGGDRFADRADHATKEQQEEIAEAILAGQGPGAWPNTYHLGAPGQGPPPGVGGAPIVQPADYTSGGSSGGAGGGDRQPYGLPKGTDIRQGAAGFPPWVYATGQRYGLKASTYPGHQETGGVSGRIKSGQVAPNPDSQNRGIDWWGSQADMDRFAGDLTQNGMAEQVIHYDPTTGQKYGFPANADYSASWNDEAPMVHTRFSESLPVNPMTGQPHAGSGAAPGPQNAPNISPASKQQQALTGALSGLLSGIASDSDPKSYQGILQQPGPRQSAVHYDNSIHISNPTVADPAALRASIKEEMNSRFLGASSGIPQGGPGSP